MQFIRRFFPPIFLTTCLAVLACALFLYQPIAGASLHVVLSGSMGAALPAGSLLINREVAAEEYVPGDIVTFLLPQHSGELVTHRITRRYQNSYGVPVVETKGDANTNGDAWIIPVSTISGKRWFYLPWLGYGIQFLQRPLGFLIFSLLTFAGLVMFELRFIARWLESLLRPSVN